VLFCGRSVQSFRSASAYRISSFVWETVKVFGFRQTQQYLFYLLFYFIYFILFIILFYFLFYLLFYFIMTTCFGQPTVIRPTLQNLNNVQRRANNSFVILDPIKLTKFFMFC